MLAYVTDPFKSMASFDFNKLRNDLKHVVAAMDDIIDENINNHALQEQRDMAAKYRNLGIGIMGFADALIALGLEYGSEPAVSFAKRLMQFMLKESIFASVKLADKRGSFPGYTSEVWNADIVRKTFNDDEIAWLKLKDKLRNCSLISIAPSGSIATMLNLSTGSEPVFAFEFNRRTVSLEAEEKTFKVYAGIVDLYAKQTGKSKDELPSYFVTAEQIRYDRRVAMQGALQCHVDTAISSTCNLPATTTLEDIKDLYLRSWSEGCKGQTLYVSGSREAILSTDEPKKDEPKIEPKLEDKSVVCEPVKCLARGEVCPTSDDLVGIKRKLMTGCGSLHVNAYFDPADGELKEVYLSKGSTGG